MLDDSGIPVNMDADSQDSGESISPGSGHSGTTHTSNVGYVVVPPTTVSVTASCPTDSDCHQVETSDAVEVIKFPTYNNDLDPDNVTELPTSHQQLPDSVDDFVALVSSEESVQSSYPVPSSPTPPPAQSVQRVSALTSDKDIGDKDTIIEELNTECLELETTNKNLTMEIQQVSCSVVWCSVV